MGKSRRKSSKRDETEDENDRAVEALVSQIENCLATGSFSGGESEALDVEEDHVGDVGDNKRSRNSSTASESDEKTGRGNTKTQSKSGKKGSCHMCHEDGHLSKDCPARKAKRKSKLTCNICGEKGHVKRECPGIADGGRRQCRRKGGGKKKGLSELKDYESKKAQRLAKQEARSLPKPFTEISQNMAVPAFDGDYIDVHTDLCALQGRLLTPDMHILECFSRLGIPSNLKGCISSFDILSESFSQPSAQEILSGTNIWGAVGVSAKSGTALSVSNPFADVMSTLKSSVKNLCQDRIVAIGVVDLDYSLDGATYPPERQKCVFLGQLMVALDHNLPVIVSCDQLAEDDFAELLTSEVGLQLTVCMLNCQCSPEKVLRIVSVRQAGTTFVGFCGNVTYSKAKHLHDLAFDTPLELILLATSSPLFVPAQVGGGRQDISHPGHLYWVAEKISNEKHLSVEEVFSAVYENVKRCFPKIFAGKENELPPPPPLGPSCIHDTSATKITTPNQNEGLEQG